MSIPVIDASVAIKWFLPEIKHKEAGVLLKNHKNRMLVPDLFFIEFDAIVTKKVRQNLVERPDSSIICDEVRNLPFISVPYELVFSLALNLSTSLPITHYDACYLAVAVEYNEVVVTADKRFYSALRGTPFESYVAAL